MLKFLSLLLLSTTLYAADNYSLQATSLSLWWAVPFVGILLSLALWPLIAPRFWHQHFGKIAFGWALLVIVPMFVCYGWPTAGYQIMHTILLEYVPFIIMITTLFTIAGGIKIVCNWDGKPIVNTIFLLVAALLANLIGTTGAAMLFIRPFLTMNAKRQKKTHLVIFFIFLVCNIGGSLTALGDPPLFLGFLQGVDFFWPLYNLFMPFVTVTGFLLLFFFIMDTYLYKEKPNNHKRLYIKGGLNFVLLGIVMAAIIVSGHVKFDVSLTIFHLQLQNVIRDLIMVAAAVISFKFSPKQYRQYNQFSWGPILEVAKVFAAIFVAAVPLIAILKAGSAGSLGFIVDLVNNNGLPANDMYFYLTGALSSFLDNAPTYLIFFYMAGGDATTLMGPLATTLTAISCGAVFMGAITYIGNAPNFMIKAIAETHHIPMPSFFGYMGWSLAILLPLFIVVSLLYF